VYVGANACAAAGTAADAGAGANATLCGGCEGGALTVVVIDDEVPLGAMGVCGGGGFTQPVGGSGFTEAGKGGGGAFISTAAAAGAAGGAGAGAGAGAGPGAGAAAGSERAPRLISLGKSGGGALVVACRPGIGALLPLTAAVALGCGACCIG